MKIKILVSTALIAAFAIMLNYQVKAASISASKAPATYPITYPTVKTSIYGTVTYSGRPASNVTITATKQGSPEVYTAITDSNGTYTIDLTPGTYTVVPSDRYNSTFSPAYRVVQVADYSAQADFKAQLPAPATSLTGATK